MPTSKDIARLAGVSQTTVSRVLANKSNVREETRQKVLSVLDSTGYVPNEQARAMRTRRTGTVGVVTGRITNPFYPELIDALGMALTTHGLRMVLWATDTDSGEAAAIEAMRGGLVDGVLFTSASSDSPSLQSALMSALPVVLVIRSIEGARCDQVTSDNIVGGGLAAAHFIQAGRTDVAVLGQQGASTGRERLTGFAAYMRAHGVEVPANRVIDCGFFHDAAKQAALKLLAEDHPPNAWFCVNDIIAFGVLDAAAQLGVRAPEDIWVIGYDDVKMASWNLFDLTTLSQPVEQIAEVGVEMLLRRLSNPTAPFEHRRFMPELIVRGSAPEAG
ncbi:LacI family DNA-binding transcriptional regulator [Rhodococcus sp. NPDC057014]|uniref:LacI family DNA-binding transcriptional regulator n=1 Tax=Rhodococcus sp. NPDC057014 TaxID=3346000 RepID=UPI00363A9A77